jgi:hypothetical protein
VIFCWGHGAKDASSPTAATEESNDQEEESWGGGDYQNGGSGYGGSDDDNDKGEKIESRPSTKEMEMASEIQTLKAKLAEMEAKLAATQSGEKVSMLV